MQEGKQFKPVRVKATTKESAIEQALLMAGAVREEVDVEVLEEDDKGVTVRISPVGTASTLTPSASPASAAKLPVKKEEVAEPAQEIADDELAVDAEEEVEVEVEPAVEAAADDSNFSSSSSLASSEAQQRACDVAQDILDRMGLDAQAKLAEMPESVGPLASSHPTEAEVSGEFVGGSTLPRTFLDIEGEDVGILIGKHGQTLRAFQYLLNLSLNNSNSAEGVYVMVDAGDYRARRATVLERAVHNAIERARGEHRAVRLEPMPAHERRLVHLLLQSETDLTTSSEGREPWRRVVVAPEGVRASFSRSGSRSGNDGRRPSSRDGNHRRRDAS